MLVREASSNLVMSTAGLLSFDGLTRTMGVWSGFWGRLQRLGMRCAGTPHGSISRALTSQTTISTPHLQSSMPVADPDPPPPALGGGHVVGLWRTQVSSFLERWGACSALADLLARLLEPNKRLAGLGEAASRRRRRSVPDCTRAPRTSSTTVLYAGWARSRRGNLYTTTVFLINSAIVKLCLTATVTYRVNGRAPGQFLTPNEYNVRGGIEAGFMSTTLERGVALHYASSGGTQLAVGVLFEMQMGMVSGADFSIISQYPHEREILYNPLTGLEVCDLKMDGSVTVVVCRPSINMRSLTYDEVVGRRRKLLVEMGISMALEVEATVAVATARLATARTASEDEAAGAEAADAAVDGDARAGQPSVPSSSHLFGASVGSLKTS